MTTESLLTGEPVMKKFGDFFVILAGFLASASGESATLKLSFVFDGAMYGNMATAKGYVLFDSFYLGDYGIQQPFGELDGNQIIDISMTVEGASSGNGVFGKSAFLAMFFISPFFTPLDYSKELVGQPIINGLGQHLTFGQTADGASGDFNLQSFAPGAPINDVPFVLGADQGGGPDMRLTSLTVSGVPEVSTWVAFVGGFGMMGIALRRRRRIKLEALRCLH